MCKENETQMIIHSEGYLEDNNWWHNPNHPNAFNYADLDEYYPKEYIKSAEMPEHVIQAYVKYVQEFYKKIVGKQLESLVEFGSGGGWFLKAFQDEFIEAYGLEGTLAGCGACIECGISGDTIRRVDFRHPVVVNKKYDIALCTEVAEHVEPTFAGTLVRSLTQASDLIWFSSEPPNTNRPHLHHCNEQPLQYWINLFDFFGYACYMLPDYVHSETAERSRCIFINVNESATIRYYREV